MSTSDDEARLGRWIHACTSIAPKPGDSLIDYIRSGIILCHLVNRIAPGSVKKVTTLNSAYAAMERIKWFLDALKYKLEMRESDLFDTVDLYESKSVGQVIHCLLQLGVFVRTLPGSESIPMLEGDVKSSYQKSEGPPTSSATSNIPKTIVFGPLDEKPKSTVTHAPTHVPNTSASLPPPNKPAPKPPTNTPHATSAVNNATTNDLLASVNNQVRRTSLTRNGADTNSSATTHAHTHAHSTNSHPHPHHAPPVSSSSSLSDSRVWSAVSSLTSDLEVLRATVRELQLTDQHKSHALGIMQSMIKMQDDKNEHFQRELQSSRKELINLTSTLSATNAMLKSQIDASNSRAAEVAQLRNELAVCQSTLQSVSAANASTSGVLESHSLSLDRLAEQQEAAFAAAKANAHAPTPPADQLSTPSAASVTPTVDQLDAVHMQLNLLRTQAAQSQSHASSTTGAIQRELEQIRQTLASTQTKLSEVAARPIPPPVLQSPGPDADTAATLLTLSQDTAKAKKQNLALRDAMIKLQHRCEEGDAVLDRRVSEVTSMLDSVRALASAPPPSPPPAPTIEEFSNLKKSVQVSRKMIKALEETIEVFSTAFEGVQLELDASKNTLRQYQSDSTKLIDDARHGIIQTVNQQTEVIVERRTKDAMQQAMETITSVAKEAATQAATAAAATHAPSAATAAPTHTTSVESVAIDPSALHSIQSQLATLQSDLTSSLQSTSLELRTDLATLKSQIDATMHEHSTLRDDVTRTSASHAASLSSLSIDLSSLTSTSASLVSSVATLRADHDEAASQHSQQIADLRGDCAWLREKITDEQDDTSQVEELTHRVKLWKDDIQTQLDAIRRDAPPNPTSTIQQLQGDIDQIRTNIADQTKKSERQRGIERDDWTQRLEQIEARIKQIGLQDGGSASCATKQTDAATHVASTPIAVAPVAVPAVDSSVLVASKSLSPPESDSANPPTPPAAAAVADPTPTATATVTHTHRPSSADLLAQQYAAELDRMRREYEERLESERIAKGAAELLLQKRRESISSGGSTASSARNSVDYSSVSSSASPLSQLRKGSSAGGGRPLRDVVHEGDEEDDDHEDDEEDEGDSDSDSEDDDGGIDQSPDKDLFTLHSVTSASSATLMPAGAPSMAGYEAQLASMKADFERKMNEEREMTRRRKEELLLQRNSRTSNPTPAHRAASSVPVAYSPLVVTTADDDFGDDPAQAYYAASVAEGPSDALRSRMLPLINASRRTMSLTEVGEDEAVRLQANLNIMRETLLGRRRAIEEEEEDEQFSDDD